ncbi:MAG TPA: DNA repair protein RecN, partial [Coleofasciculaceae cyanobacterium]
CNGQVTTKAKMLQLRDRLVTIAAQGQTVQLLNAESQRDWLDECGGPALTEQRATVANAYEQAQLLWRQLRDRRTQEAQRLQQLDLYQFQLQELTAADLTDPQELEQLEQERDRLTHVVDLQHQSYQAYELLYAGADDSVSCADLLGKAEAILQRSARFDRQVEPILDLVSSALTQVTEAGLQINAYGAGLESDPHRLAWVEERILFLKTLGRKYGLTVAELIDRRDELDRLLADLTDGGQSLEALEAAYQATYRVLEAECDRLHQLRQKTARSLETQLVAELIPLAMDRVQFVVEFARIPPSPTGFDRVTYTFSPNPGEPLQPLSETASGGEMSRFLLAFEACFSKVNAVQTAIFDEIDAGVSGRVAQAIAQKLHHLSQDHQVLCVTHQPIVAAMADRHFRVDKVTIGPDGRLTSDPDQNPDQLRTVVRLSQLEADHRRLELAQLAGGADVANDPTASLAAASAFAESLLDRAASLRQGDRPAAPPKRPPRKKP